MRLGPAMQRCLPDGVEQITARRAGQRAEGHRRIGHAKRGQPDIGYGRATGFGHQAQRIDIRRLALVGGHAQCGIAFYVLHAGKTLAAG